MVAIGDKVKYRSDGEIATVVAVHDDRTVDVKTEHWGICEEEIGGSVDIVSDGPVRTVQRIIPGTYDGVKVGDRIENFVSVEFHVLLADADQLERAVAVLTALAGALRDEQ